jgi:hypothetical protein
VTLEAQHSRQTSIHLRKECPYVSFRSRKGTGLMHVPIPGCCYCRIEMLALLLGEVALVHARAPVQVSIAHWTGFMKSRLSVCASRLKSVLQSFRRAFVPDAITG